MSRALQPKPRVFGQKTRICIIASKYNETFTDSLVENAVEALGELIPFGIIDVIRVPGAFEIPATLSFILDRTDFSCFIALGLIIRGDTAHADLIGSSVTNALQTLAVESKVPIIHEVLLVDDESQAHARCMASANNRGKEAAKAAASIIDTFEKIKKSMPKTRERKKSFIYDEP